MQAASCLVLAFDKGTNLEAEIFERSVNEKDTPVEEEGRMHQRVIQFVNAYVLNLSQLVNSSKRMSSTASCALLARMDRLLSNCGV